VTFSRRLIWTVTCNECGDSQEIDGQYGYDAVIAHLRDRGWALTPRPHSHLLEDVDARCPKCVGDTNTPREEDLDANKMYAAVVDELQHGL
jgi:hypothetical protein